MDSKMKNYPVLYSMEIHFHYVFHFQFEMSLFYFDNTETGKFHS